MPTELEQRARELLAAELVACESGEHANWILHDGSLNYLERSALAAIAAALQAQQPDAQAVVWALQFPDDDRLNLSIVFDTKEEAENYADKCGSNIVIVPLYLHPQPPTSNVLREIPEPSAECWRRAMRQWFKGEPDYAEYWIEQRAIELAREGK